MAKEPIKATVVEQCMDQATIEAIIADYDCEVVYHVRNISVKRGNSERSLGKLRALEALDEGEVRRRVGEAVSQLPRRSMRNGRAAMMDAAWLL